MEVYNLEQENSLRENTVVKTKPAISTMKFIVNERVLRTFMRTQKDRKMRENWKRLILVWDRIIKVHQMY